jgi:hypothetical protein
MSKLLEMARPGNSHAPPVRRRRAAAALAACLAAAVALALASWTASGSSMTKRGGAVRLFSPNSVWNHPLAPNARLDPKSRPLVRRLVREVNQGTPWIQTDSYSTPLYQVGPNQRRVHVTLYQGHAAGRRSLQRAFNRVPIPPYAKPAAGSDGHMTVWQPSTDMLWEFWQARKQSGAWHATWGGAMKHVSRSPGYYTRAAWPGALLNWGSTASSLPVIGGTMLIRELRAGQIRHALAMVVPNPRARQYSWPAQRTDGSGPQGELPEGARLRLPASLNLDAMHLPRITLMMARAAKRYGLIVRDRSAGVGFFAQDPGAAPNPYDGAHGLFGGRSPTQILARFPWRKLRVLKMSLCTDQSRLCQRR